MPLTIPTVTDAPALPLEAPHMGAIDQRWRVTPEGALVDGKHLRILHARLSQSIEKWALIQLTLKPHRASCVTSSFMLKLRRDRPDPVMRCVCSTPG
jgi:hypothetical protein